MNNFFAKKVHPLVKKIVHSTLKHSRVAHSLIFFNSFDFDIGFDVQKWPIQLLLLILIFNSDHPTIDFDFQKGKSNFWFWFWCSKVTTQLLILMFKSDLIQLLILILNAKPHFWSGLFTSDVNGLHETKDYVSCGGVILCFEVVVSTLAEFY